MLRNRTQIAAPLALLSLSLASSAAAQTTTPPKPAEGFALNRYNPAERGSEWFALDSLDLEGHIRPAMGATFDWAHKPLVVYGPDGDEQTVLVENQIFAHVGASLVLWDRLRLGVSVPLAVAQTGSSGDVRGYTVTAPAGAAFGDLRLGFDVRLFGVHGDPLTLALGAQVFAPTGSREQFTGDGAVRLLPRLSAAGDYGMFTYAATLGIQYRAMDQGFVGKETGTEFIGGVSAGVRALGGALVVGPELFGSAVIASAVEAPSPSKAPVEMLMGAHYTAGSVRVGAGAGPGLTRGLGEPAFRGMASLEWTPPVDKDRDGDGILNAVDACVSVPGVASADPKKHGCPSDRDGDGIFDRDDACPDVPGVASADPKKHGCPSDRDGDTVLDVEDACPDVPGVRSDIPAKNGCPLPPAPPAPPDRDRDLVLDSVDRCPDVPGLREAPANLTAAQKVEWEKKFLGCPDDIDGDKISNIQDACPEHAGPAHKDPTKNGCPLVVPGPCQIKIMERLYFKTMSDKLETVGQKGATTQAVLQALFEVLRSNPKLARIEVQGHASQDTYSKNQELSELRAASVVKWLYERGIEPGRLSPVGYGTTRPAQGVPVGKAYKELHQRVEFHIIDAKCNDH
jgi:OOP family OmpA-OmpF porin